LHERDAYRALFAFGGALSGLDPTQVSNIAAGIANARLFANEVVNTLKSKKTTFAKAEEVA
jgi:chromosome partitioning protein